MISRLKTFQPPILKGLSMILWALTALLGGYEIFLVRIIVTRLYLRLLDSLDLTVNVLERLGATGFGNIAALLMAVLAVAVVVGGFDYHWKYGGQKPSFRLLDLTSSNKAHNDTPRALSFA